MRRMDKVWKIQRITMTEAGKKYGRGGSVYPVRVEGINLARPESPDTFYWRIQWGCLLSEQYDWSEAVCNCAGG